MNKAEIRFRSLGTDIFLSIVFTAEVDRQRAEKDLFSAKKIYFEKEKIFSRFDPESELSRLNQNLGKIQEVSPDTKAVSEKSLVYYQFSQKLFDPRIIGVLEAIGYNQSFVDNNFRTKEFRIKPPKLTESLAKDLFIKKHGIIFKKRMDFSGLAKGYITDLVARFFKKQGWENFLVDSGGDIFASGLDEKKEKWLVDLEGISPKKLLIKISNEAVATSGITRRKWSCGGKKFHHLINPKEPETFSFDMKSVTVVSETAEKADVWAKVLFLLGIDRGLEYSNSKEIKSMFLDYRGNLSVSKKIKDNLVFL